MYNMDDLSIPLMERLAGHFYYDYHTDEERPTPYEPPFVHSYIQHLRKRRLAGFGEVDDPDGKSIAVHFELLLTPHRGARAAQLRGARDLESS